MPDPVSNAAEHCEDLMELYDRAAERMADAREQLRQAEESYDEAGGFIDDSTAWDVSLAIGAGIICVTASGGICALGILGGAFGVAASEGDRFDEIGAAEEAVDNAEIQLGMAEDVAELAWNQWWNCFIHEIGKEQDEE